MDFLTAYGTIGSSPAFYNKNKSPYAENYELSIQRQITSSDLLTVSYVGTQGHHLLLAHSANPGSPAACLQLIAENATPKCGPGGENNVYTLPSGALVGSSRTPLNQGVTPNGVVMLASGPVIPFGNDSYFITIGNSVYNSRRLTGATPRTGCRTLLGYTFSKSLDDLPPVTASRSIPSIQVEPRTIRIRSHQQFCVQLQLPFADSTSCPGRRN